uniref:Uncharacterized protein n=2 Tax=Rhizophagus irregularis (strain DAOM 181602 / DAOM 197198 / MUCL 43194) TaxID=747089 RepID=U9SLZ5_RHIID
MGLKHDLLNKIKLKDDKMQIEYIMYLSIMKTTRNALKIFLDNQFRIHYGINFLTGLSSIKMNYIVLYYFIRCS